jgi:hypothetical protein
MSRKSWQVLSILGSFALVALAQTVNAFNGTWLISFDGRSVVDLEGKLVLSDGQGTWKVVAHANKNPCVGLEAPVETQVDEAGALIVQVMRSKVLTGCRDYTMRFSKVDDSTLRGQLADGRPISLTRQ